MVIALGLHVSVGKTLDRFTIPDITLCPGNCVVFWLGSASVKASKGAYITPVKAAGTGAALQPAQCEKRTWQSRGSTRGSGEHPEFALRSRQRHSAELKTQNHFFISPLMLWSCSENGKTSLSLWPVVFSIPTKYLRTGKKNSRHERAQGVPPQCSVH